jgi:3-hydroxyisobutyrate dehydrogenase-like beta-hydroxyacid dehydrogenase
MSSVSFIGLATMARAMAARALMGGNAVELIGGDTFNIALGLTLPR